MAKEKKIRVTAMVRVDGVLTDVDTLTEDQRVRLANAIRCTLFNASHAGIAEAAAPGNERMKE